MTILLQLSLELKKVTIQNKWDFQGIFQSMGFCRKVNGSPKGGSLYIMFVSFVGFSAIFNILSERAIFPFKTHLLSGLLGNKN